jgi:hypothetical protein
MEQLMHVLIIDEEAKKKVQGLIATAKENPYSFYRLKKVCEGVESPCGDHYAIYLQDHKIVYSIEQQPKKTGGFQWTQHLSVSVAHQKFPCPAAIELLLPLFNMPPVKECYVYLENEEDEGPGAVNLIAEYDGEV